MDLLCKLRPARTSGPSWSGRPAGRAPPVSSQTPSARAHNRMRPGQRASVSETLARLMAHSNWRRPPLMVDFLSGAPHEYRPGAVGLGAGKLAPYSKRARADRRMISFYWRVCLARQTRELNSARIRPGARARPVQVTLGPGVAGPSRTPSGRVAGMRGRAATFRVSVRRPDALSRRQDSISRPTPRRADLV